MLTTAIPDTGCSYTVAYVVRSAITPTAELLVFFKFLICFFKFLSLI